MFMDFDDFKKVNDSYGYDVGDKFLKVVVMCIFKLIREFDIVFWFGGDEFVILFLNIESKKYVDMVVKKLIEEFKELIIVDGVIFYVFISIGIVIINYFCVMLVELLCYVDIVMYEVKVKKGVEYCVYDVIMNFKVM